MTIEESLHAQLVGCSSITTIVGGRIWHGRLPPNSFPVGATMPALTYWRVMSKGFVPLIVKPGGRARPRFQLDCWAKADTAGWALGDAVRRELLGFRGFLGGRRGVAVSDITLENYYDMFERNTSIYHLAMDVFIFHGEESPEQYPTSEWNTSGSARAAGRADIPSTLRRICC